MAEYSILIGQGRQSSEHSVLSASSAHRWLNCTASIKASEGMPDNVSDFAQTGTNVHELCCYKAAKLLEAKNCPAKPEHEYTTEDELNASAYADFVKSHVSDKTLLIALEQTVDYSEFTADESYGTADCLIIDDDSITIIDYKNGAGVKVDSTFNPQVMLYALGAYSVFKDILSEIKTVTMAIYQPNINNISTQQLTFDELIKATATFKDKAKEALSGNGTAKCGDWCRFCKAKAVCSERAKQFSELIQSFNDYCENEDNAVTSLSEVQILEVLKKGSELCAWVKDVQEYALNCAKVGKEWQGFKLSSRSVRKYTSDTEVAIALQDAGIEPYEVVKKLKTITNVEKELGKKKTAEVLNGLVEKVPGKETLTAV